MHVINTVILLTMTSAHAIYALQGYKACEAQGLHSKTCKVTGLQGYKVCKVTRLIRLQYVQGALTDKLLEKPATKNNIYEIFFNI